MRDTPIERFVGASSFESAKGSACTLRFPGRFRSYQNEYFNEN